MLQFLPNVSVNQFCSSFHLQDIYKAPIIKHVRSPIKIIIVTALNNNQIKNPSFTQINCFLQFSEVQVRFIKITRYINISIPFE